MIWAASPQHLMCYPASPLCTFQRHTSPHMESHTFHHQWNPENEMTMLVQMNQRPQLILHIIHE